MAYYMCYLFEGQPEIRLETIEAALKKVDEQYAFAELRNNHQNAEIRYQNDVYGTIDLEYIKEADEEIQEMIEDVESVKGWFVNTSKKHVLEFLKLVKVRIVVRVLWGGRKDEDTLAKLDPLWEWLMANHKGLLYADGEGFYDKRKLILKIP